MRKLILSMMVTVDGYIDGPGGEFLSPEWSADLDQWTLEIVDRCDTLLYGRTAWQGMAAYWPDAEKQTDKPQAQLALARFMNQSRKIVFSRWMTGVAEWGNSELAAGDLASLITAEKQKVGKDMAIFGGAKFARTAISTGLIDEYWLLTIPMLFGGGSRLFEGHGPGTKLTLIEAQRMDTGAVLTRYSATS